MRIVKWNYTVAVAIVAYINYVNCITHAVWNVYWYRGVLFAVGAIT